MFGRVAERGWEAGRCSAINAHRCMARITRRVGGVPSSPAAATAGYWLNVREESRGVVAEERSSSGGASFWF